MKLSIIIPVYNERRTIKEILRRIINAPSENMKKEVIIVDDFSIDDTISILKSIEINPLIALSENESDEKFCSAIKDIDFKLFYHEKNCGKSAALRTGFEHATGDIILIQDSDLEYDPRDYPRLLKPILDDKADVVYGSRFLGDSRRVLMFWHTVGNRLLTLISNVFTNLNLTDMETCYKVFRAEVIKDLKLESERFGFEPEVTVKIAKMRYRIYEVPISYHGRSYAEGKKITWKDGFHSLWLILKYSFFTSEFLKSGIMEETLTKLTALHEFNYYIYESLRPYLGSDILEVGAGNGNITEFLLSSGEVTASESDKESIEKLRSRFPGISNLKFLHWDLNKVFPDKKQKFDSIVCLNVLEHIRDDLNALKNIKEVLKDQTGNLILLVPAHKHLFSDLDKILGHHKRYDMDDLKLLLNNAGFEIIQISPFNMFGLFGWFINGKIFQKKRLPTSQIELYKYLSPLFISIEKSLNHPFGLSYLVIAKKS